MWGCSHSDTVFAYFAVGQSLGSSHLRGEHHCRSSAARNRLLPGRHHSGSWNYRNVRRGCIKTKQQLVPKRRLCRGRWSLYCASVQWLSFSLRVQSCRALRLNKNLPEGKSKSTTKSKQEVIRNRGMAGVGRSIQPLHGPSIHAESFP